MEDANVKLFPVYIPMLDLPSAFNSIFNELQIFLAKKWHFWNN